MRLLLIGAGHAHLHLAKRAEAFVQRGIEVVLVSPGKFWYSGMATGLLGGQYLPEEATVDPGPLIKRPGGRFIEDTLVALDPGAKRAFFKSGSSLEYDRLSLNIGSETAPLPGSFAVKPIANLWRLRLDLDERFKRGTPHVTVVGGGATGCELAANLASLASRRNKKMDVTLFAKEGRLLSEYSPAVSDLMREILEKKGVELRFSTRFEGNGGVVVAATGLMPPKIFGEERGVKVNRYLQSAAHPEIFGAGDCIELEGRSLPKLGVYGVREAPFLFDNLLASFSGGRMKGYNPQKKALSILNLGDGTALALRPPFYWHGRAAFWLKDRIDRAFMAQYVGY